MPMRGWWGCAACAAGGMLGLQQWGPRRAVLGGMVPPQLAAGTFPPEVRLVGEWEALPPPQPPSPAAVSPRRRKRQDRAAGKRGKGQTDPWPPTTRPPPGRQVLQARVLYSCPHAAYRPACSPATPCQLLYRTAPPLGTTALMAKAPIIIIISSRGPLPGLSPPPLHSPAGAAGAAAHSTAQQAQRAVGVGQHP